MSDDRKNIRAGDTVWIECQVLKAPDRAGQVEVYLNDERTVVGSDDPVIFKQRAFSEGDTCVSYSVTSIDGSTRHGWVYERRKTSWICVYEADATGDLMGDPDITDEEILSLINDREFETTVFYS